MLGKPRKAKIADIDTLVGEHTELQGDVHFKGGLHVNGLIKGNVVAEQDSSSVLIVSEQGRIEGEVRVPNVILNGTVTGDVHAEARIELAARARVTGNVFYNLIEMAMGAEVNGNLVHRAGESAGSVVKLAEKAAAREAGPGTD
ncbi:MAG TPA: polymer-forming cytoskeletal protein [Gammaproteobacteria bacterium]|nr:polymer-forming cytoskeletal protein [Gammaproteobacteria bacterium]